MRIVEHAFEWPLQPPSQRYINNLLRKEVKAYTSIVFVIRNPSTFYLHLIVPRPQGPSCKSFRHHLVSTSNELLVISRSHAPEVSTPSSKHKQHSASETHCRNSLVSLLHHRLESLQAILDERSLCKSLLTTPLQASQIRTVEGKSEDDKRDNKRCAAKEGVDTDDTVIGVVIRILNGASEDANDTRHTVSLVSHCFQPLNVHETYALLMVTLIPYAVPNAP